MSVVAIVALKITLGKYFFKFEHISYFDHSSSMEWHRDLYEASKALYRSLVFFKTMFG
jgi:hypothetical protein